MFLGELTCLHQPRKTLQPKMLSLCFKLSNFICAGERKSRGRKDGESEKGDRHKVNEEAWKRERESNQLRRGWVYSEGRKIFQCIPTGSHMEKDLSLQTVK